MANRPIGLQTYIGQDKAKLTIGMALSRVRREAKPFPHVLLFGPAGLGKTSLAQVIANELQAPFFPTNAPSLNSVLDIAKLFMNVGDYWRDCCIKDGVAPTPEVWPPSYAPPIVFIDEIHALPQKCNESLYTVLEDQTLTYKAQASKERPEWPLRVWYQIDSAAARAWEASRDSGVKTSWIPWCTVVGATTHAGKLPEPLFARFGLPIELQDYKPEDMVRIVAYHAYRSGAVISPEAVIEIAKRSRGTPRVASRFIDRCIEVMHYLGSTVIDESVAWHYFNIMEIDNFGLDAQDRKYLNVLAQHERPVGLKVIADLLNSEPVTVESKIEPYLVQLGFLTRGSRGRSLTEKGIYYAVTTGVTE